MLVMTAKVDKKKIVIGLAVAAVALVALILFLGGGKDDTPTGAPSISTNDGRVQFLKSFGWEVNTSPKESGQVRIPKEQSEAFSRYNDLQKSQGYDLSRYAGKTVMRYVYQITNYPNATQPVYATILMYQDKVIGGDVTNTAVRGVIQGFQKQAAKPEATKPAEVTKPTEATQPTEAAKPTQPTQPTEATKPE